jgi:hypothetical protein
MGRMYKNFRVFAELRNTARPIKRRAGRKGVFGPTVAAGLTC